MANVLQSNTSGIDCEWKAIQEDLYTSLDSLYDFEIFGYGRAYRNKDRERGYIPEVWSETEQQYKELYLEDTQPFTFFLIDEETHRTSDEVMFIAPSKIVFIVDLSKINDTVRVDAEVHNDVAKIIREETNGSFRVNFLEKGIEKVFRGFETKNILFNDMQPWHVFAFKGDLSYSLIKKCK